MKTTLDLPDDLIRAIKLRAVHEGRRLKEVVADLLVAGLNPRNAPPARGKPLAKSLPLIKVRPAQPTNHVAMSPQEWCDWIKEVELQGEVEHYEAALGHQHVDRVDSGSSSAT
ncbi:MAG: hypothetical protein ACR2FY_01595 [Pirellulaceae bacterium]